MILVRMPKHWGPKLWSFIHVTCLYSNNATARKVLYGVLNVLPCDQCQTHYRMYLSSVPPSGDLFKWSVDCHNWINIRLGKPVFSYDQALRKYS
jgi:hypothetical protein